jgi:hypothetical protein
MPPHEKTGIWISVRPKRRYFIRGILMARARRDNELPSMQRKVRDIAGVTILVVCGIVLYWIWKPRVSSSIEQRHEAESRMSLARARGGVAIRAAVVKAGLPYPPREIFIRAFKRESAVEAWAREDAEPFKRVADYRVLASSGHPGPKRREGDLQVPEGFYRIDRLNPVSNFHLSLGLNYPNESDRILSDREHPGSDIYIHGKAASIGCLPLGDPGIEELYLLALDVKERGQKEIAVHIFPARMSGAEWDAFAREQIARDPVLERFWKGLQPGFDAFERTHLVPEITVASDGSYRVAPAR